MPEPWKSDVTVVITSCGRPDLLQRTLDSFLRFNTCPISRFIITEDSCIPGINEQLKQRYSSLPFDWIEPPRKRGQLASIDEAYSHVDTKYIFHCEDDWEFYAHGFIEKSRFILENCPGVMQVWLRAEHDTNGHPIETYEWTAGNGVISFGWRRLAYGYVNANGVVWDGFSFNPGLRRLGDYKRLAPYAQYKTEGGVSLAYKGYLYSAVILTGDGSVRHIGEHRHVVDPTRTATS